MKHHVAVWLGAIALEPPEPELERGTRLSERTDHRGRLGERVARVEVRDRRRRDRVDPGENLTALLGQLWAGRGESFVAKDSPRNRLPVDAIHDQKRIAACEDPRLGNARAR